MAASATVVAYVLVFRCDNFVKFPYFTKSVCQLCIISQLFSAMALSLWRIFFLRDLGTFISFGGNCLHSLSLKLLLWHHYSTRSHFNTSTSSSWGFGIRWTSTVPESCVEQIFDRSPDALVKSGFQNTTKDNRQGTIKPTKLNTAKLSTISHRESFEQEMDTALTQSEEKENCFGKPGRKHQDRFEPNDQELHIIMSRRDQAHQWMCKPGALDPPLQHI